MMGRRGAAGAALAVWVALAGLAACGGEPMAAPQGKGVDSTAAIADGWTRYLESSAHQMALDRARVDSEVAATGQGTMTLAPGTDADFRITSTMTDAWFGGSTARGVADAIVSFQTPTGGWSKHIDYSAGPRRPGMSFSETAGWEYVGTIDNGATTTELQFLARAYAGLGDARYRQTFLRGIDYLLLAQQPTGCWAQVYPLMGGYHDAATFNDDAITHVVSFLRDIGRGGVYAFVPGDVVARTQVALAKGIDCIVASQIVVSGVRTAWCQQHDMRTLQPVIGRSYELPGISGQESAGIVSFLMSLSAPDARVVVAVHAAADWFQKTAIYGWSYDFSNGVYQPQAGAGPLWARIAEIGTNRPIFANRDGVTLYDFDKLTDRRTGYAWFGTAPAATLRTYQSWAAAHPRTSP